MQQTEQELIEKLKLNDETAFRQLVLQFQDKVVNTCYGFAKDEDDARDIGQEVFIEIHRSIGNFRHESALSTWIYRIAVTKSLEFLRKRERKKRFGFIRSLVGMETEPDELESKSVPKPDTDIETEERRKLVMKNVNELPDNQRTAMVMCYFEELSYQEIADVMKTTISSVESLLFRGRQNLKKKLGNYYESHGF